MFNPTLQNISEARIRSIVRKVLSLMAAFLENRGTEVTAAEHAERILRREQLERAARARTDLLLKAQ